MAAVHPIPSDRRFHNHTGKRFGRLTVISYAGRKTSSLWNCVCDCGETRVVAGGKLTAGRTKSCGCLSRELSLARRTIHGFATKDNRLPEYNVWKTMKQRCCNPNLASWDGYGARGITVCERWRHSFEAFLADVGRRPSDRHTIERVDNNGDYEPGNVRWATKHEQARNKRNSIPPVTFKGKTQTLHAWANELGFKVQTLTSRYRKGWPVRRIFSRCRCGMAKRYPK